MYYCPSPLCIHALLPKAFFLLKDLRLKLPFENKFFSLINNWFLFIVSLAAGCKVLNFVKIGHH